MKYVPDIDWNELILVRLHGGRTTCWTAWRRSIAHFIDPETWSNPDSWASRFKLMGPKHTWGFVGHGLIAIDMDRRRSWSINDYQTPGTMYFPAHPSSTANEEVGPLKALLAMPEHWRHVTLKVVLPNERSRRTVGLGDVVDAEQPLSQRLKAMLTQRPSDEPGHRGPMVLGGEYQPPGWVRSCDRGQAQPAYALMALRGLSAAGFEAPDWDSIRRRVAGWCDDLDEEDVAAVMGSVNQMAATWGPAMAHTPS